jgi:hypothetical protein
MYHREITTSLLLPVMTGRLMSFPLAALSDSKSWRESCQKLPLSLMTNAIGDTIKFAV